MEYPDLTKRQAEILHFIKETSKELGYPPTVREIASHLGLSSPATVHTHLSILEKKGYLHRSASKQRALEIVDHSPHNESLSTAKELTYLPLVGTITAGQPILAEENIEDYFPVATDFLNSSKEVFMLKVSGDSMIDAGIHDGDLLMVEKTPIVANGEIAAVLIDDSATVKYFYKDKDCVRLEPANSAYTSILIPYATILGRVIGLYRRL